MTIKEYLKKKNNPQAEIQAVLDDIKSKVDTIVTERFSALEKQLKEVKPTAEMDIVDKITRNVLKDIKGEKGDSIKGDDGHTPTDEELLALIKPLIPKVKDGHTPTSEEILKIIKPLIPQVKDGATPTKEELLNLIQPLIPQPIKGDKGKDGIEIKSQEIATKLNTLEEKVELKVIKGLKDYLKKLEGGITRLGQRKSGGGGGLPIHETHSVGSTTTSITLGYNVANSGASILLIYDGGVIEKDVHYTISGKVITFLETLSDNSYIYAIYTRS